MPDENYWPAYETRLRERLRSERPSWTRRLAGRVGGFGLLTIRPLPAAVGLALLFLAVGWWTWQRRQAVGPSPGGAEITAKTPTPQPNVESHEKVIATAPKPGVVPERRTPDHPTTAKLNGEAPPVRREERGGKIVEDVIVSRGSDQSLIAASLFTPETVRHFEKAQLMLRSFRNASAAERLAATDLAYERQLSRRLLYRNILLRRDAEMKGNLPAEEALGSLEPFLIDIANLPDNPSPGELGGIRERLERKELIASLQISSAHRHQIPYNGRREGK